MPAVVFDINDEYSTLPGAVVFRVGENLKFRLDRVKPRSFLEIIQMISPFGERTVFSVAARMPGIFSARIEKEEPLDIAFLRSQSDVIFTGRGEAVANMRASYERSLNTIESIGLFATRSEIEAEDAEIKQWRKNRKPAADDQPASAISLRSAFYDMDQRADAGIVVFSIGGQLPDVQRAIVKLARDTLIDICNRQTEARKNDQSHIPIYPTVVFEEAHMYMDNRDINELIPLIRHLGMNLFFVTNTPGELPDSVFRLLDNLIMTRMVNEADIRRVAACGLVDRETIEDFATVLPEYHALLLSAREGVTRNFPLVFKVRDFQLPRSGETRSWRVLSETAATKEQQGGSSGTDEQADSDTSRFE
jgi:hypothetical protein